MKKSDLYTTIAAQAFGVPYEEITEEQRGSIEKAMLQAVHRGSQSNLERVVTNSACTATMQAFLGKLVLTGSFDAVIVAAIHLGHEIESLEVG